MIYDTLKLSKSLRDKARFTPEQEALRDLNRGAAFAALSAAFAAAFAG
jgi:hypothetical protein